MAASQVALLALIGKFVMGVFQTSSAGKAGHGVPGNTVPVSRALLPCGVELVDCFATEVGAVGE